MQCEQSEGVCQDKNDLGEKSKMNFPKAQCVCRLCVCVWVWVCVSVRWLADKATLPLSFPLSSNLETGGPWLLYFGVFDPKTHTMHSNTLRHTHARTHTHSLTYSLTYLMHWCTWCSSLLNHHGCSSWGPWQVRPPLNVRCHTCLPHTSDVFSQKTRLPSRLVISAVIFGLESGIKADLMSDTQVTAILVGPGTVFIMIFCS